MEQSKPVVWVVDDDDDFRAALAEVLEGEGYETRTASNGREALDLLRSGLRPDAITLDLVMREVHGYAVLRELRETPELSTIPVFVLSGVFKVPASGYVRFFSKPVDVSQFLEQLREVLSERTESVARQRLGA